MLRSCVAAARRLAILSVLLLSGSSLLLAGETALDRYVHKPDSSYSWKLVKKSSGGGMTQFVIDLKSQTWRTTKDVDRTLWQHWVTIIKPDKPTGHTAFLFIDGGSNGGNAPRRPNPLITLMARESNAIVVELQDTPNQPLVFHNDGVGRKEDDLIAYTWDQFLKGGDDEWPARLPMVKGAVRAMDCAQELLNSEEGGKFPIDKFVVAGGSKRGWTTWCTAAVDPRVAAIVPLSIDCLNGTQSMRHHVAVYGFYTFAVGDYLRHHIMQRSASPRMKLLNAIEDPYSYRDRLTMPKFVVAGSGDQYFCPDSSQFYYPELPGEKLIRYIPNADHSLGGSDARESVVAYFYCILTGKPRPTYSWTFENDGSIKVQTPDHPIAVKLWQANNPKERDFRVERVGRIFKSQSLKDQGDGTFVAKIEKPEQGWTASFVELTFDVGAPHSLKVTTSVRVTPDILPHADVDPTKAPYEASVHPRNRTAKKSRQ